MGPNFKILSKSLKIATNFFFKTINSINIKNIVKYNEKIICCYGEAIESFSHFIERDEE